MKKILSIILALCITMSLMGSVVPAFAADEAGVMTVAELNTVDTVKAIAENDPSGQFSVSVGETYNGAPVSLKWTFLEGRNATTPFVLQNTDVSTYTHFRMRFYSANAGESFYIFAGSSIEGGVANPYFYRPVTSTGNGWQEISVPLSYFTDVAKPVDGVETEPSWNNVAAISLYTQFIDHASFTHTPGASIYIDKIWFENAEKTYTSGKDTADGDITVFDVTSVADQDASTGDILDYIETVNARESGNAAYLMREIPALSKKTTYYDPAGTIDVSGKGYLNMWVYSPKALSGALIVRVNDSDGNIKGYFREDTSSQDRMLLNYEGWKLISIDLSDSWGGGSKGTYDATKFDKVEIITNWQDTAVAGGATSQWHTPSYYGIDKIWFSATKPAVTTSAAPTEPTSWTLPSDATMLHEFNSATAALNTNKGGDNSHANDVVNVLNNNLYGCNVRTKVVNKTQTYTLLYSVANNAIEGTKNHNYLNFWLYNPGIKYTADGTITGITFNFHGGGAATENYPVTLDWEGWKLVSLKLSDALKTTGFQNIWLGINGANDNAAFTNTAPQNPDLYLSIYYDFDNIFFSEKAIEAPEVTTVTPDGNKYTFLFNNALEATAADKISVYKNYEVVNDATVSVDGSKVIVETAAALAEGETYQIKFDKDMRDVYGTKLAEESYVYEDAYVSKAIASDVLTVDNENLTINGFEGMTLAQVREALTLPEGMTLEFEEEDETLVAESGMLAAVTMGEDYYEEYELDIPLYAVTGAKYYVNGAEAQTFAAGEFKVELQAVCYNKTKEIPAWMAIAQYSNEDDSLMNVQPADVTIKSSGDGASATLVIDSAENSKVKVFLWNNPSDIKPMANCIELTPAAQ